ncbi:MAG: hypothetical protein AB7V77_03115 [Candidatus Woesearchaeota archaeon]
MRCFNKKGSASEKVGVYVVFIIIFSLVMIATISVVSNFVEEANPIPEYLDIDITLSRIVNSCFAYVDEETGVVYQNQLDISKITSENLKNCFKFDDGTYDNVKVTIISKVPIDQVYTNTFKTKIDVTQLCSLRLNSLNEANVQVIPCKIKVEK